MLDKKPVKDNSQIKINEIFYSIQGESTYAGLPTVFIRTTGCNLRCSYCDTTYSYQEGQFLSLDEILAKALAYRTDYICLTGGEPLLQSDSVELMKRLCDMDKKVSLETSGAIDISKVDSRVKIILDIKTPDSGAPNSFLEKNLDFITPSTEIKFVICSEKDFDWAEDLCQKKKLFRKAIVLYSPSYEKVLPHWLAEKILHQNSNARLHLQQHKYIWSSTTRGV